MADDNTKNLLIPTERADLIKSLMTPGVAKMLKVLFNGGQIFT